MHFYKFSKKVFLKVCFLFTTLSFVQHSFAQDKLPVNFGKVEPPDFSIQSPLVDANTTAVIIADVGTTYFEGNIHGWFSYVYKRQRRIKILDKKAFRLATVEISLYQGSDDKEVVSNVSATTYNIENGKVVQSKLDAKDVFEEKEDKNHVSKKFTMPAVKEGSIIEYTYTIKSPYEYQLPAWEFQSADCPTLWSEYNVVIPRMLSYMSVAQGYHNFFIDKSTEGSETYSIRSSHSTNTYAGNVEDNLSVSAATIKHRWVMKDLPAFNIESFIFSPKNIIDKISFQLYQTYDGQQSHDVSNNWKKLSDELMKREDFGAALDLSNDWLDDIVKGIVKPQDDLLQTAKQVYYYVQNNYTCTNHYDKFIKTTLKDVVKKKSGTVGDINLLLAALLTSKGIEAKPVLLSTRSFGYNNPTYPFMDKLNYVICKIKINSLDYYLDATKPFLSFGKLPLECYNGHAREISKDTTAVYFLADSIKETSLVNVIIINNDKGEVEGSYTEVPGFYKSLDIKNNIASASLIAYKEKMKESYPEEYSITNMEIDSFQTPDGPLARKFDFKLSSFSNAAIVYFNPLMGEGLKANPFVAAERLYPVEMPYKSEDVYMLRMEIPNGYKVDELPKSCMVKLNEDEGFFEYIVNNDGNYIQLRRRVVLNTTVFTSKDYQTLRDFYAFIVKKDAEQIVFKKIK